MYFNHKKLKYWKKNFSKIIVAGGFHKFANTAEYILEDILTCWKIFLGRRRSMIPHHGWPTCGNTIFFIPLSPLGEIRSWALLKWLFFVFSLYVLWCGIIPACNCKLTWVMLLFYYSTILKKYFIFQVAQVINIF